MRFATGLVDVTVKGAVPIPTVDMIWLPVTLPEATTEVGVIAPNPMVNAGVVVGLVHVAVTPLLAAAVETFVTVPPPIGAHTGSKPADTVKTCPAVPINRMAVILGADW